MEQGRVLVFLKSLFNFDYKKKTKINVILDICFLLLFLATLVSIPLFSFKTKYTIITWILTIATFLIIGFEFILYYKIKIDYIVVSLFLFLVSALLSSALNGFIEFVFTPLLLNAVTIILYLYFKANNSIIKPSIAVIYLALCIFVFAYLVLYGKDVIAFNTERLGTLFGDQNDIALFLSLCFSISVFLVLKSKVIIKIFAALMIALSFLCGASTGSKIFILSLAITLLATIIISFGKKRWYLSIIIIVGLVVVLIILFSMPFMANLKKRLLTFISSFFDIGYNQTSGVDASSFDRFHLLKASFHLFLNKPLFGYGVNGFQTANGFLNGWSHNNLGEFLSDFGLVGTLLFNFPIILSIVSFILNKNNNSKDKQMGLIIIIFFISAMISVAYTREKIYSFIIPISFALLFDKKSLFEFSIRKNIIEKKILRRRVINI